MALGGENSEDSRNVHSEREWSNEMREDDLDYIDNDQNENILLDELEIEKRLKKLKYDYTKETASKALFKGILWFFVKFSISLIKLVKLDALKLLLQ